MPKKCFRHLLVALLVAMIPVQGFAALTMGICRDLQHTSHDADHGHAAPAVPMNAHEHGAASGAGVPHGIGDGAAEDQDAHCAACAACGVSAGIDAQNVFPIAEAPRAGVVAHVDVQFSGFVPDAVDRPPLTLLA